MNKDMPPGKQSRIKEAMAEFIKVMGWDEDENFDDTPDRFMRWVRDYMGSTRDQAQALAAEHLQKTFPTEAPELQITGPSKVFGLCPHHLQNIEYDVWIAYIPEKTAVGLSKLTRVAMELARYPFIQEEFTHIIAEVIMEELECKGVMVIVKGLHNCMRVRGVKQPNAYTMTSAIAGVFNDPPPGKDPKKEVLELIKIGSIIK